VRRGLDAVSTSPALVDGRFLGTAGFDGFDLAASADALRVAVLHAAEAGTARLHRLLDPAVSGLPAQLAAAPGRQAGLVALHKHAVGLVHEQRRGSAPASLGASETSLGQEDVQSYAVEAVRAASAAVAVLRTVTASELLAVHRGRQLGAALVPASDDLDLVVRQASEVLPHDTDERPVGPLVAALAGVLRLGWGHEVLERWGLTPGLDR
jgi:histidine ammonia-lyase